MPQILAETYSLVRSHRQGHESLKLEVLRFPALHAYLFRLNEIWQASVQRDPLPIGIDRTGCEPQIGKQRPRFPWEEVNPQSAIMHFTLSGSS